MALFDEASPICRGKNLSWETVLLFYNNMPREAMPKAKFHAYTESKINGWTTTHSQIARQLAFYYEEGGICYPRFTKEMSYADLFKYMQNWAAKYFIPNPYSPSLKEYKPTCIYRAIINAIDSGESNFDNILDSLFGITLSSHDKVRVYLNNYTDLIINDSKQVSINNRALSIESTMYPDETLALDPKKYFEYFSIEHVDVVKSSRDYNRLYSLQQIFYGAPGTGKSFEINRMTKDKAVIRTTFHPDSDYSTFVGAYKPTTIDVDVVNIIGREAVNVKNADGSPRTEKKIIYEFVPQAFLQAYVNAWKLYAEAGLTIAPTTPKEQFLIIEEINRGNCAQIFGDLFQLLDRDNEGFSDYYIKADKDLQKYLEKEFKDIEIHTTALCGKSAEEISKMIKEGDILLLPSNLYIWATMNTSDQSLFPIDSAFKRRWEWIYKPIGYKNINWIIEIGEKKYYWADFQKEINQRIFDIDNSEDKQLGDYFVNADQTNNIISSNTLLNKILFYLWNDVCKDDPDQIFRWIDEKQEKSIKFSDFFDSDRDKKLQGFMSFLKVKAIGESDNTEEPETANISGGEDEDVNA